MEIEPLITIVVVGAVLSGFALATFCYFCLWERCKKKRRKSVASGNSKLSNGYPKMPHFRPAARDIQPVQIKHGDQYTRYADLSNPTSSQSTSDLEASVESVQPEQKKRHKHGGYRRLDRSKTQQSFFFDKNIPLPFEKPIEEAISCTEIFYPQVANPTRPPPPAKSISSISALRSDRKTRLSQVKRPGRSLSTADIDRSKLVKGRYKSEPNLLYANIENDLEGSATSVASSLAAAATSVLHPAAGHVEFGLFYNPDNKCLDITINKLLDVHVKPENFIGLLEKHTVNSHEKHKSKTYLKEHDDESIELVAHTKIGYLVYITLLLPDTTRHDATFTRHTNVVFGSTNFIFNELFSLSGHSLEELHDWSLVLHVLTQFGEGGEPIVVGEIVVPLQRLQPCLSLPFLAAMETPEYPLELESPLKETHLGELQVVISYSPMHHQLVVKVIQATGIPKLGMTGHPNVSVKTSLYYCGSRINKQSTSIHKRQKEPVFNETLLFDISKDRVSECDLLFEVRHHGPVHRTVIGYVMVGSSAAGSGANHWRQLLDFSHFEKAHRIMPNKPSGLV